MIFELYVSPRAINVWVVETPGKSKQTILDLDTGARKQLGRTPLRDFHLGACPSTVWRQSKLRCCYTVC